MATQYMSTEAFTKMVREMIREEIQSLLEGNEYKGPIKKCPKCGGQMKYDDGRDAFVCEKCGHSPGNGPAGV